MIVSHVDVRVLGGEISDQEIQEYLDRGTKRFGSTLSGMDVKILSEEEAELTYHVMSTQPSFERIRRITGYLVGSLSKWNDAKRAEEHDRVKHSAK